MCIMTGAYNKHAFTEKHYSRKINTPLPISATWFITNSCHCLYPVSPSFCIWAKSMKSSASVSKFFRSGNTDPFHPATSVEAALNSSSLLCPTLQPRERKGHYRMKTSPEAQLPKGNFKCKGEVVKAVEHENKIHVFSCQATNPGPNLAVQGTHQKLPCRKPQGKPVSLRPFNS